MMFLRHPFRFPHSAGCSTTQRKHPWELLLFLGGWQLLPPLSCLSSNAKHPWRGQVCAPITPHFSYLPAEPCQHLCIMEQTPPDGHWTTCYSPFPRTQLDGTTSCFTKRRKNAVGHDTDTALLQQTGSNHHSCLLTLEIKMARANRASTIAVRTDQKHLLSVRFYSLNSTPTDFRINQIGIFRTTANLFSDCRN